jgi:DNA-binding SARP family transcriptional activator
MSALTIRLLGGFEAIDPARHAIKFHTRKAAALLAYLAMSPGKEFSRGHLMNLLWSDRAEAQASNSLRQALSLLRKALNGNGISPLIVSSDGVRIDPEAVSTDAVEFERLARTNGPERHGAVQLYRGEFLADFMIRDNEFEEWRRQKASRLASLALDTFDDLLHEAVAVDEYDNAVDLAQRLLAVEPAHESAHRALMKAHYVKGRRAAALQQYEACRDFLFRELGVEPEPETEAVRRMILTGKERPTAPADTDPANTLGVLPFSTHDDDIDAQRLANGLVASIAMELGRFRSLSVVSPSSSLRFKDSHIDLRDIADSLDVRYLVEGSVDRVGDRLQGFVRLTEPRSGRQLWGDRFEAGAEDFFEVMDGIVQSIVGPLAARLESEEISVARRKPATRLDAYDHWLRGLSHLRIVSADEELAAREHFQAAIDLDPNFARAHAGLAMATFNAWSCGAFGSWHDDIEQCLKAALQALTLDPSDHWPHMVLASVYLFRREFDKATAHYDRAIALNPNDTDLLAFGSCCLTYLGDPEAGVEVGLMAMRLNPFYTEVHLDQISAAFQMAGRYDEAKELHSQYASGTLYGDWSWRVVMEVELGNLDYARHLAATKFREGINALWPGVSSSNDIRENLETINPWKRQDDHDRFFGALEKAGVFDEEHSSKVRWSQRIGQAVKVYSTV